MGWRVLEAKYGRQLQAAFAQPGGEALRQAIDEMDNEEYQAAATAGSCDSRQLLEKAPALTAVLAAVTDADLPALLASLGV
ncbi:MAG: hypothetical protein R2932_59465 [Caldilineaceae bacterium]